MKTRSALDQSPIEDQRLPAFITTHVSDHLMKLMQILTAFIR